MRANIANTFVCRLPFTSEGADEYFDSSLGGFHLLVGKRTRTFYAEATHRGKSIRVKIGRSDVYTASEARRIARDDLLPKLRQGIDPRPPKAAPVVVEHRPTFRDVFTDYKLHGTKAKASTLLDYERAIDNHLPEWWDRAIAEITTRDVSQEWRRLSRGSIETAKTCFRVVSAVMHHAVRMELIGPNERHRTEKTQPTSRRQMSDQHLRPGALPHREGVRHRQAQLRPGTGALSRATTPVAAVHLTFLACNLKGAAVLARLEFA